MRNLCLLCLLLWGLSGSTNDLDSVRDLLAKGKLDQADLLLKTIPKSGSQLALRAYIQGEKGYITKAIILYSEAIEESVNSRELYDCLKNISWLYRQAGQYVQSQNYLEKAIEILPNLQNSYGEKYQQELHKIHFSYGMLYYRWGVYNQAISHLDKAFKNAYSPATEAKSLNMLGRSAHLAQNYKEALSYFEKIEAMSYQGKYLARALHNKALLYIDQGHDPVPFFEKALALKKGQERFVTLQDLGTYLNDIDMLIAALEHYPNIPDEEDFVIYRTLEHLYLQEDNLEEAQKYDQRFYEASMSYIEMMRKSKELALQYNIENALDQYGQNKELLGENSWMRIHIGWLLPSLIIFVSFAAFVIIRTLQLRKRYFEIERKYR